MLIMRLALPIIDAVSSQDFLDLVTAYELSRSSPSPDLVFQSVDELPISLNGMDISDKGFNADKDLSNGGT